jgi:hypothetical protein
MPYRLSLPMIFADAKAPPNVDVIRKRLGGRTSTEAGAGELVSLPVAKGSSKVGVVLHVKGDELDVWVDAGLVRRTLRARTGPAFGTAPAELTAVARDARVFAALQEGQRVRYEHEEGLDEATLVEKCRFGALLLRSDGILVGVGFRRLWPVGDGEQN